MKLNLGCGYDHRKGFINVDSAPGCRPDLVHNLEETPWPWESNVAEELVLNHVLEHLGRDTETFYKIIKEIYRVSSAGALVIVAVPHPRHDNFINDPSHVRVITPQVMQLFDQRWNRYWIENRFANSTLGLYLNVDFELMECVTVLDERYSSLYSPGDKGLTDLLRDKNNVAIEYRMKLRVRKPCREDHSATHPPEAVERSQEEKL